MTKCPRTFARPAAAGVAGFALAVLVGRAQAPPTPGEQQGRGRGMQFTEPSPLDFNDHEGYASIFDGQTLDGWDGNPKFWRVENGAIVGESTPERPSGNSYIAYRKTGGEGLHPEVRDQSRRHGRERPPISQPHRVALAGEHSGERHRL